jgi:hypothetical protein
MLSIDSSCVCVCVCIYIYTHTQPRLWMSRAQTVDRTSHPIGCMPEPGDPAWRVPRAPPHHSIYRGCQPHGPTPPIHLLGFRAANTKWVSPLPDSTMDRQPCKLVVDTEWSRTSVITGPSTRVTGSVCYMP